MAPNYPAAHYNFAHFYLKQHNFDKAKEHFQIYLDREEDEERKSYVEKVLQEIDSRDEMNILFREAYDFIRLGKEEEGLARIDLFLKSFPEVWNAWFLLGWAYRRMERYQEGKEAFGKAIELGPEQADTLNELAICHMELNELQECRTALERALKLEPENVKIISNMGILSLKEQKSEEARGYFRSVLELNPEDPIAKNYIAYIDGNN